MSNTLFKQEYVPLFNSYPSDIQGCVLMDISDDGEEGGRVERRASRIWQVSLLQDMPSVQGVVVHVVGESGGDGLGQEGMDEHCHSSAAAAVSLYMSISWGLMRVSWYSHPLT